MHIQKLRNALAVELILVVTCIQMNSHIKNPQILLLKCSIEYLYREESKFSCIDPIVLQVSDCSFYPG